MGTDTTGHQLAWILAMVATHPEIDEKLIKELKDHDPYGSNRRKLAFEDLSDLSYLNAVIKEGFRVTYVVSGSFMRLVPKDISILGYRVPKGTLITFPGNRAMNTEADWGDPEVVRPEQWLTGEDMSTKYFEMFQTGPRVCPGQKIAIFEMRLAIVKLVTKYRLSSKKPFDQPLKTTVNGAVIECEHGIWLEVASRCDLDEKT